MFIKILCDGRERFEEEVGLAGLERNPTSLSRFAIPAKAEIQGPPDSTCGATALSMPGRLRTSLGAEPIIHAAATRPTKIMAAARATKAIADEASFSLLSSRRRFRSIQLNVRFGWCHNDRDTIPGANTPS